MSTPFAQFNMSDWPLVRVTIAGKPSALEDIDVFQAELVQVLQCAKDGLPATDTFLGSPPCKVRLLLNLSRILDCSIAEMLRAGSFIKSMREYTGVIACTALVVENRVARSILSAITTLQPLQSEHVVCETEEQALAWIGKRGG